MHTNNVLQGQVSVSGKGNVEIELDHRRPHSVVVDFQNPPTLIPCNPPNDRLGWEVHRIDGKYVLKILWNITSGARDVIWAVGY